MSKKKVVVKKTVETKTSSTEPTTSKFQKGVSTPSGYVPVFAKENYMWLFAAIGLIILGFLLMMGGGMPSSEVWDDSIIYSFRRITLAPIAIIGGFVLGVYAIFK